jgi:signal transduction histidine kinase
MPLLRRKKSISFKKSDNDYLSKRNEELIAKNNALSLLGHLYELSILTLKVDQLTTNIASSILDAFKYESVAIFLYDAEQNSMSQIASVRSERYLEQLRSSGINLPDDIVLEKVSTCDFFDSIVNKHLPIVDKKFGYILKEGILPNKEVELLAKRAKLESIVIYPLTLGTRTLGMMGINLSQKYEDLAEYEKNIIGNIANVTSLAIDKALTYAALQEANDKLKNLDNLKTEFLSLASHQLRSSLTAIKGYASLLLEGSYGVVADIQKEPIDRIFQSSNHLTKVVSDLLNVSKIESNKVKHEINTFDVEKTTRDSFDNMFVAAKKKGLEFVFKKDDKGPYMVSGDIKKVGQVITSIIDNAIWYTEKGEIVVMLSKDSTDGHTRISVADTGMGIGADEKERIFQKFVRGEAGKTNATGSGLGLYIARQTIEAYGGKISVDSKGKGMGSVFTIDFKV